MPKSGRVPGSVVAWIGQHPGHRNEIPPLDAGKLAHRINRPLQPAACIHWHSQDSLPAGSDHRLAAIAGCLRGGQAFDRFVELLRLLVERLRITAESQPPGWRSLAGGHPVRQCFKKGDAARLAKEIEVLDEGQTLEHLPIRIRSRDPAGDHASRQGDGDSQEGNPPTPADTAVLGTGPSPAGNLGSHQVDRGGGQVDPRRHRRQAVEQIPDLPEVGSGAIAAVPCRFRPGCLLRPSVQVVVVGWLSHDVHSSR
jgi:hypothetical protein